ncbi:MAG: hypothetical protein PHU04_00930 [Candidatus Peribacteraceae bacterium]|nr:hypothetical protein [Candidatus Peribacteraceae bacterium]
MQAVPSQSPFPYDRARDVLCAVLQRTGAPQQRVPAFVATAFGAALVTTLAVCARAGASDHTLQQVATRQLRRARSRN